MSLIRLDAIVFDAGTQVRESINEAVVAEYAERMSEGDVFPAVVLFHDGNRYYMADGFHRGLAAKRIGQIDIVADVRPGTKADALWFALKAFGESKKQGLRPNNRDAKHAIFLAFAEWPDMSTPRIAEQASCTHQYVSKLREEYQLATGCKLPDRTVGKDGKSRPAERQRERPEHPQRQVIREMVTRGVASAEITKELNVRPELVADVRRELGVGGPDRSRDAARERLERIRKLAADGYTTRQIASSVGIADDTCRLICRREHIDVPADQAVGKTKRHDSNRIIDRIVMDAANLTEGSDLIDFNDVDRRQLGRWVESLTASRKALGAFIRRLTEEQQKHGEAA